VFAVCVFGERLLTRGLWPPTSSLDLNLREKYLWRGSKMHNLHTCEQSISLKELKSIPSKKNLLLFQDKTVSVPRNIISTFEVCLKVGVRTSSSFYNISKRGKYPKFPAHAGLLCDENTTTAEVLRDTTLPGFSRVYICTRIYIYRVFHGLWTLLQEVIS
jgi:hypothetical protein